MLDYHDEEVQQRPVPTLAETMDAIKAGKDGTISATVFYGLSDLTTAELPQVKWVWDSLPADYRSKIMRRLVDVSEANFELNYRTFGWFGLSDRDAGVRHAAIDVLWEDQSLELMSRLIERGLKDEAAEVRAAAASALGRFILLGELGELPQGAMERAQDAVISVLQNEQELVEVRRRALEAIANCSHDIVVPAINQAYQSTERAMQVSAIFAMGRSCDNERWSKTVLKELQSADAEMRFEAARAAGELELAEAVPLLARLVEGNDREIKEIAIWSLGEIGGKRPMKILGRLADEAEAADDAELLSAIEDAMGNASLVDGELFL